MRASRLLLVTITGAVAIGASALALHLSPAAPASMPAPLFQGADIDSATLRLFERSCQDCHSQRTNWPWYGRLPPASWLLQRDVDEARSHLDLSHWDNYPPDQRRVLLSAIGVAARAGVMPPQRYLLLHPESRLSPAERQRLYEWTRAEKARLTREK